MLFLRAVFLCLVVLCFSQSASAEEIYQDSQLRISLVSSTDRAAFVSVMANEAVVRQAAGKTDAEADRRMAGEWFDGMFEKGEGGPPSYGFKVSTPDGKSTIGFLVLDQYDSPGLWESSTGIAPEHQGKGYGTTARREVIRYAFGSLDAKGLVARVKKGNEPSVRLTERLGFQLIGETTKPGDEVANNWWEYRLSRPDRCASLGQLASRK